MKERVFGRNKAIKTADFRKSLRPPIVSGLFTTRKYQKIMVFVTKIAVSALRLHSAFIFFLPASIFA